MALRLRRVSSLSHLCLGRPNFVSKLYLTTLSPVFLSGIRVGSTSNAHRLSTNTCKSVTNLSVTSRKVNIAKQPACSYSGRRGDHNNKSVNKNNQGKVVPPTGIISPNKSHFNRAGLFPQFCHLNNSVVAINPARAFRTWQPSLKVFYAKKKELREMSTLKVESSTTPDSKKSPSSGSDSPDSIGSSSSSKSSPPQVVLRDDVVPQWKIQKENYLKESLGERKDRCKKYTLLESIETWPEYYSRKGNTKSTCPRLNHKVSIWKGDITSLMIDTIVNAANESLMGGGGVDGAIHSAAGKHLKQECKTLKPCPTGHAVITGGYELPSKYVIHTVGPRGEDSEKLRSCYENSLNCLLKYELKSIAFPCVSTGIYGYPNDKAAEVVLSTVREWLEKNHEKVERVIFCLFLEKDIRIYEEKMQKYFPMPSSETVDKSGDDESKVKPEK